MKDMDDMMQEYMANNRMFQFEGERGVGSLKQILKEVCGYSDNWGGVLENFFADNPGATEAVLEWISSQRVPEWQENLTEMVGNSEEDLTEEQDLTA